MGASLRGDAVCFASAAVGAVRLAIPVETVVQAIAVPDKPALLPRRQGALCTIVLHEGAPLPVVDLARWVEVGAASAHSTASARILVLRADGRSVGLQVDALAGLVEVPVAAIARLHHDDHPEELFHSAVRVADSDGDGDGDGILSLLDVERLATLAATWHAADAPAPGPAATCPGASVEAATCDYALLQLDGLRLGIAAAGMVEVMPMPALERFGEGIDGAWCLWGGRHLPVLAAGALPGLPPAQDAPLLAVVEHAGLVLGLPARAVLALQAFAAFDTARGALTATVYDADGAELRLLDSAALFARFPEALLSRQDDVAGSARASSQDSGKPNDIAYVVYEAAQTAATPIAAITQILAQAPGALGATMAWRGAALPLVDLRAPAQAEAAGHVLVVGTDVDAAGYVVSRVAHLVPAGGGRVYRLGAASGRAVEFVTVDGVDGEASYRIVALGRVAPV